MARSIEDAEVSKMGIYLPKWPLNVAGNRSGLELGAPVTQQFPFDHTIINESLDRTLCLGCRQQLGFHGSICTRRSNSPAIFSRRGNALFNSGSFVNPSIATPCFALPILSSCVDSETRVKYHNQD